MSTDIETLRQQAANLTKLHKDKIYIKWVRPKGRIAAQCRIQIGLFFIRDNKIMVSFQVISIEKRSTQKNPQDKPIKDNGIYSVHVRDLALK